MYYVLNIKLRSRSGVILNPARVLDAMTRKGMMVVKSATYDSLRIPVLVAVVLAVGSVDSVKTSIHALAQQANLRYIAVLGGGVRELIGPSPEQFVDSMFVMTDGQPAREAA